MIAARVGRLCAFDYLQVLFVFDNFYHLYSNLWQ